MKQHSLIYRYSNGPFLENLMVQILKQETSSTYCVESMFYLFIMMRKMDINIDIQHLVIKYNHTPTFYMLMVAFEYIAAPFNDDTTIKKRRGFEFLPELHAASVSAILQQFVLSSNFVRACTYR